jgi:hypothetical protein
MLGMATAIVQRQACVLYFVLLLWRGAVDNSLEIT